MTDPRQVIELLEEWIDSSVDPEKTQLSAILEQVKDIAKRQNKRANEFQFGKFHKLHEGD